MRAAMVVAPGKLEFVDQPEPEFDLRDVLVRTTHSGLSSRSEIERYARNPSGKPEPIGYNIIGVVERIGSAVTRVQPGDRVFAAVGHADRIVAKETDLIVIPDGVDDESACFAYLPTLGTHALRLADYRPGELVAISGQGIIGQTAGLMARLYGARTIAIDISDDRLALARASGAHLTLNPLRGDLRAEVAAFCGSAGLDIVIETASSWKSLSQALDLIGHGGRVVMLGIIRDPMTPADAERVFDAYRRNLHGKEATLIGASNDPRDPDGVLGNRFTYERNVGEILDHVAAKTLNLRQLITHRYSINELEAVYQRLLTGQDDHLGVVFRWPENGKEG